MSALFRHRKLVIATKHAKERVLAPALESALGVVCEVSEDLDTDLLGTFTGEVERSLNPLETAREKCRRAMREGGYDLAVASEGSFGPHPAMPFMPSDEELLLLLDSKHGIEVVARELSAETNYATAEIGDDASLLSFAEKAGFPEHGLILRPTRESSLDIHKGITDRDTLLSTLAALRAKHGHAVVETDMRANYNPTRMAVIEAAAKTLVHLVESTCPQCSMPGFTVTEVKRGLPCGACGLPTNGVSRYLSVCAHCGYLAEEKYPHGKVHEDPQYCEFCNP